LSPGCTGVSDMRRFCACWVKPWVLGDKTKAPLGVARCLVRRVLGLSPLSPAIPPLGSTQHWEVNSKYWSVPILTHEAKEWAYGKDPIASSLIAIYQLLF
jgi:hypothetical protein